MDIIACLVNLIIQIIWTRILLWRRQFSFQCNLVEEAISLQPFGCIWNRRLHFLAWWRVTVLLYSLIFWTKKLSKMFEQVTFIPFIPTFEGKESDILSCDILTDGFSLINELWISKTVIIVEHVFKIVTGVRFWLH